MFSLLRIRPVPDQRFTPLPAIACLVLVRPPFEPKAATAASAAARDYAGLAARAPTILAAPALSASEAIATQPPSPAAPASSPAVAGRSATQDLAVRVSMQTAALATVARVLASVPWEV